MSRARGTCTDHFWKVYEAKLYHQRNRVKQLSIQICAQSTRHGDGRVRHTFLEVISSWNDFGLNVQILFLTFAYTYNDVLLIFIWPGFSKYSEALAAQTKPPFDRT